MQTDLFKTIISTYSDKNPKLRVVTEDIRTTTIQVKSDSKRVDDYLWSDDGIRELMEGIFISSLRGLRDRRADSMHFAEEAAWFFDSSNQDDPFSASNCAAIAGFDIDSIRIDTARSLPQDKVTVIRLIDSKIRS